MSQIKVALLSITIMAAVGAAANPASALEDRYYEPTKAEIKSSPVEGKVESAWLQTTVAGTEVLIEGTRNVLEEAEFEAGGKSKGKINYENPVLYTIKEGKLSSLSACKVEPFAIKFKDKLITQETAEVVADEFEAASGSVLVEISVTGASCLLKGKYEVKGTEIASLGSQGEVDGVEHELVFNQAGSKLTVGTEGASYTNTTKIKQKNGKEWYVN